MLSRSESVIMIKVYSRFARVLHKNMASLEELRSVRIDKMKKLRDAGMDPFASRSSRTHTLSEIQNNFEALSSSKEIVTIAGRVMAIRGQGAILFIPLYDGSGTLQAVIKEDSLAEQAFSLFQECIDIGDFIEVTGTFFTTQRGEQSIEVTGWTILTKAIQPLPDKWHGLADDDERYRKRYLDILMNQELRDIFEKKTKFWRTMRRFFEDAGFMEVETPTLEVTTGGAEARPFITHHNDFDMDVYMRISVGELWQKRLMSAGFPKTFEIGRVYRNEGSSPDHLQEFTNMEFYMAYANYEDGMKLVRDLYITLAKEVFGTTKFTTRGHTFDLSDKWETIEYVEEIKKQTGIDVLNSTDKEMSTKLEELGVTYNGTNRERLMDTLWKYCRKQISGPVFVTQYPTLVMPLAKRDTKNQLQAQCFNVVIGGSEVGKGYSELNDPIDQNARFEEQRKLIEAGDEEAMMPDQEFVEMLEHGMPPTCGFGVGDRLFAFLVDKPIRETILFPLMRPRRKE